jgi:hypothetical protein
MVDDAKMAGQSDTFRVIGLITPDYVHFVILCPFCGELHLHGAGKNPDDIAYGPRAPHCSVPSPEVPGYTIVPPPNAEVERMLRDGLRKRAKKEKGVTI